MNSLYTEALSYFVSYDNINYLYATLRAKYPQPDVAGYLHNIADMANNFAQRARRDFMLSDPMRGVYVEDLVRCFNQKFISEHSTVIEADILGPAAPRYTLSDGEPTGRSNSGTPNETLERWKSSARRGITMREDTQDTGNHDKYGVYTGVDVCDQSHIGHDQYLHTLFTNDFIRLNSYGENGSRGRPNAVAGTKLSTEDAYLGLPKLTGGFGQGSAEVDDSLLQRRIFAYEVQGPGGLRDGSEKFPWYRRGIQHRPVERDISEGLRASERDYIQQRHDRSDLFRAVDARQRGCKH